MQWFYTLRCLAHCPWDCCFSLTPREVVKSAEGAEFMRILYDCVLQCKESSVQMTGVRCMLMRVMSMVWNLGGPSHEESDGRFSAHCVLPEGLRGASPMLRRALHLSAAVDLLRDECDRHARFTSSDLPFFLRRFSREAILGRMLLQKPRFPHGSCVCRPCINHLPDE